MLGVMEDVCLPVRSGEVDFRMGFHWVSIRRRAFGLSIIMAVARDEPAIFEVASVNVASVNVTSVNVASVTVKCRRHIMLARGGVLLYRRYVQPRRCGNRGNHCDGGGSGQGEDGSQTHVESVVKGWKVVTLKARLQWRDDQRQQTWVIDCTHQPAPCLWGARKRKDELGDPPGQGLCF